jgi:hypothetical protein
MAQITPNPTHGPRCTLGCPTHALNAVIIPDISFLFADWENSRLLVMVVSACTYGCCLVGMLGERTPLEMVALDGTECR